MSNNRAHTNEWERRNKQNTLVLMFWTIAWVATMALANFGPSFIWHSNKLLTAITILINLGVGFGMILANRRHLNGLDEMQQKIQLEAMALSLGVGLVVGLGYSNLDGTNLIPFDAEISHLVIVMALTYMAGIFAGQRKFR